jgi:hypothetical protein
VSVIREPSRDGLFRVDIEIKNNKHLIIAISNISTVIGIAMIDNYYIDVYGLKKEINGWFPIYYDILYDECLELLLGYKPKSVDDIIGSYDIILDIIKKIFHEPRIPGKLMDEFNSWGDENELQKYTGYVITNNFKLKIYANL